MFFWILFVIAFIPLIILFPVKVINRKKLPKRNYILAVNHVSNYDPITVFIGLRKRFRWFGKKELFNTKFKKWFFESVGVISVDREHVGISSIKSVMKALKSGESLVIFPSGTRKSSPEEVEGLKNGMGLFALKTNTPIIPAIINRKAKLFRRNKLIIGEPLYLEEFKKDGATKENLNKISELVTEKMKELLEKEKVE